MPPFAQASDASVDLEALDFAGGVLFKFGVAELDQSDALVGDHLVIGGFDLLVKVGFGIGDAVGKINAVIPGYFGKENLRDLTGIRTEN